MPLRSGEPTLPLWVVFGLAMGSAVVLGLSRFAYALLLPAMRADLGWSFADAGAMNTANAAGYLAGALLAARVARWTGARAAFAGGLLLTTVATASSGLTADFNALLVLRTLAGLTGAAAFVTGASLTAGAASPARAPLFLGIYTAGAGLGVAASALAVPALVDAIGWRAGWAVLGVLALGATGYGTAAMLRVPTAGPMRMPVDRVAWARPMVAELVAYALFGAGYIAYMTFVIAFLRDAGFGETAVSAFWVVLGLAAVASAFAWAPALARLKGGLGAAATTAVLALGAMLPLLSTGPLAVFGSALLFGGSFLAVVTAVTTFARRTVAPPALAAAIGGLTGAFGFGQCLGPVLSGMLADGTAGVAAGLWLSVGLLAVAAATATLQRERR